MDLPGYEILCPERFIADLDQGVQFTGTVTMSIENKQSQSWVMMAKQSICWIFYYRQSHKGRSFYDSATDMSKTWKTDFVEKSTIHNQYEMTRDL